MATAGPRLATGYEKLAILLQEHIRNYTPPIWKVPIHNVDHAPLISEREARIFMTLHKKGKLESGLKKLGNSKNYPFKQFKRWYVQEAIKDFFAKELENST